MAYDIKVAIGQRVYNRGDQCNPEHWATVEEISITKFGTSITLKQDLPGCTTKKEYRIPQSGISEIDKGNGMTRIVTEEAYRLRRKQQLDELNERMK